MLGNWLLLLPGVCAVEASRAARLQREHTGSAWSEWPQEGEETRAGSRKAAQDLDEQREERGRESQH